MQQVKKELKQLLDKTYKTDADKNWFNQYAIANNLTDEQKIEFLKLPVNERNTLLQDFEFQKGGDHIGTNLRRQQKQQESSEESEYVAHSSDKQEASESEKQESFSYRDEEQDKYTYEQLQSLLLRRQQFQTMLTCPYFSDLVPYVFLVATIDEDDSTLLNVNQKGKDQHTNHKQNDKHHEQNQQSTPKYYSLVQLQPYIYQGNNELIQDFNPSNYNIDKVHFIVQAPKEHAGSKVSLNNIGEDLALIYKPQLYEKQYEKRYNEFLSPTQEIKQFIYQQRYIPGQTLKRQQKLLTYEQILDVIDYAIYGIDEGSTLYCLNSFFNYPGSLMPTHITECMDQCVLRIKGLGYIIPEKLELTEEQKNTIAKVQQAETVLPEDILDEARELYDDDVFQLIMKFNLRLQEEDQRYNNFLNQNRVITIDSKFMKANDTERALDRAKHLIRQYLSKNFAESTLQSTEIINNMREQLKKEQENFLITANPQDKFTINLQAKTIEIQKDLIEEQKQETAQKPPIYLTSSVYQCLLLKKAKNVKQVINPIDIEQYNNSEILDVKFVQKRIQENNRITFFFDISNE